SVLVGPPYRSSLQLNPGSWVPPAKANLIRDEVLRQCDALDGLADGVINDYVDCNRRFDPTITRDPLANIRCAGGADTGATCLSDLQIATIDAFHAPINFGYPLANSATDYPGMSTALEGPQGWLLSPMQPDANNDAAA